MMRKSFQFIFLLSMTVLVLTLFGGCSNTVDTSIEATMETTIETTSAQTTDNTSESQTESESQAETEQLKFSINDLSKEVISDLPGKTEIRYYLVNEDGSEETVLQIYAMAEEHDLNADGLKEILVYHQDAKKGIGIYYIDSDALKYLNVNDELKATWSDYMGNVGNAKTEYSTCLSVGFEDSNGSTRTEVYRFKDNALVYECSLEEALRK